MKAYQQTGFFSSHEDASDRFATDVTDGPYRLRGASDTTWHAQGYGQRVTFGRRIGESFTAVVRTILPVLFLGISLAALFLYQDRVLPYFADASGKWLTVSHLLLPAAFFTIQMTNRRYGPTYAFAQVLITLAIGGALVLFAADFLRTLVPAQAVPGTRQVVMFGVSFFTAGFLSIVAFDGARGPRWWSAPLVGSLVAGLVYALMFYPGALAGTDAMWASHMGVHAAVLVGTSLVSLLPYWLLRGTIQPLPGFGGY